MPVLLQIDFPFSGPYGAELAAAMNDLATSISREPGLLWKIWTENPQTREAGGIYLFQDRTSAEAYCTMHTERLRSFGITQARSRLFEVNAPLSKITRGPTG